MSGSVEMPITLPGGLPGDAKLLRDLGPRDRALSVGNPGDGLTAELDVLGVDRGLARAALRNRLVSHVREDVQRALDFPEPVESIARPLKFAGDLHVAIHLVHVRNILQPVSSQPDTPDRVKGTPDGE